MRNIDKFRGCLIVFLLEPQKEGLTAACHYKRPCRKVGRAGGCY